jgi:hypothetical protein
MNYNNLPIEYQSLYRKYVSSPEKRNNPLRAFPFKSTDEGASFWIELAMAKKQSELPTIKRKLK